MSGANQSDVARHIGVSRYRVGRLERNQLTSASVEYLSRHAAAVGLRLSVKLYPVGGGLRDTAQARYISRFIARIGKAWRVRLEVPVPIPGDLRAVDIVLSGAADIAVEVITTLHDLQAQLRAAHLKQRDIGAVRLIIVVAGSRANRSALAEARPALLAIYDLDPRRTFVALAAGRDPGRDCIVLLD